MSDICLNCNGLIMEPNTPYGYAGPVCRCPINPALQYQRPASKESGNPKKIQGINKIKKNWIYIHETPLTFYYDCKNCGNKWTEEKMVLAIAGRAGESYDYCSECYKEENEKT
jgi:hypothetical protein